MRALIAVGPSAALTSAVLMSGTLMSGTLMIATLTCATLMSGCQHGPAATEPGHARPHREYQGRFERLAPNLWAYTSSPLGFRTRSYLLRGNSGVVLIDAQFLPSAASEVLSFCRDELHARPIAALVLHANPDKFNGTATFQRAGVEVLTSAAVIAAIPEVHALRSAWFEERYRPDYPVALPRPVPLQSSPYLVGASEEHAFVLAGLRFRFWEVEHATSAAHLVVAHGPHLFTGDLVASGTHAWTELGNLAHWQTVLRHFESGASPGLWVHPGRGPSGFPQLLTDTRRYLESYAALLQSGSGDDDVGARDAFLEALYGRYPDLRFRRFAALGFRGSLRRPNRTGTLHGPAFHPSVDVW